MKNKIILIISLVFFSSVFIVFYKGLHKSNIYKPEIALNEEVPEFEALILNSEEKFNKNSFKRERYYLLNIWASWCAPCREEHPYLMQLSKNQNLSLIGLNYKDIKENSEKFLKNYGNPYKIILIDDDGTISIDWSAIGVPETFLIFDNKIIKKYIGPINRENVDEITKIVERI